MKLWITLGALALGAMGVAAGFRPSALEGEIRVGRVAIPAHTETPTEETLRVSVPAEKPVIEGARVETSSVEKVGHSSRSPLTESKAPAALEKQLFFFELELDLSPDQRQRMEQILVRREQGIKELQRRIVDSGVFHVREYDYQVRQLQAVSYEEIAGVLNGDQRRRWAGLIAEGRVGDAVLFEVLPSLVVLQD